MPSPQGVALLLIGGFGLSFRSTTDQEVEGHELGIPFGAHLDTCVVRPLRAWCRTGAIPSRPLFSLSTATAPSGVRSPPGPPPCS